MKLASRQLVITVDEQRCTPGSAQVFAGGSVRIAVSSGPPQSFEIRNNTTSEAEETPRVSAGSTYEWKPVATGPHTIASLVYPGCKTEVVVRSAPPVRASPRSRPLVQQQSQQEAQQQQQHTCPQSTTDRKCECTGTSTMSQVDEPIPFPLRPTTSRGSQTDPVSSSSRFVATSSADLLHLPPLGPRPYQAAFNPASVLPGVTAAAASAVTSSLFASPEEEELGGGGLCGQTGLRRRSSASSAPTQDQQRPASAGSVGSASAHSSSIQRSGTPDLGSSSSLGSQLGGSLTKPAAESPAASGAASRERSSSLSGPIFRPVRNMAAMQRPMSPASMHSSEETMPLLDMRMTSRVQPRTSSVFSSGGSRGALVSPTSVSGRDATHKCPRCRKEFLSIINQRRCLAVHLGHKAMGGPGKGAAGAKGSTMPSRAQLVDYWDGLPLPEKQAVLNLQAELGSEAVLRCMEMRALERDNGSALTTEQRTMLAAGRTLFEVVVRGKGLESLSGEALATLLTKTSEGTFLYDRSLPARDESVLGYNAEAALSAFVGRRLVEALLSHRQQAAEKAQRELEELEEAQKGEKTKPADEKKKDKKAKLRQPRQKAVVNGGAGKAAKAQSSSASLSRTSSSTSLAASSEVEEAAESGATPVVEDSACAGSQALEQQPASVPAEASAATPLKAACTLPSQAAESDSDLTPPPSASRYTPTPEAERFSGTRPASQVTYTNALYRAEGQDGSGRWHSAPGKSGSRSGQPQSQQEAAARSSTNGITRESSEAARSNGAAVGEFRTGQQHQAVGWAAYPRAGQKLQGSSTEQGVDAARAPKPGSKPALTAAIPSRGGRPPYAPGTTATSTVEEAFPALPSKVPATSSTALRTNVPATGVSYAAAAKVKQQQQHQEQKHPQLEPQMSAELVPHSVPSVAEAAQLQQPDSEAADAAEGSSVPGTVEAAEREQAGQQIQELGGARSTTPALDEHEVSASIQGDISHVPQGGPFPPAPIYGYAPPPPMGYYYYPAAPMPAMKFGDVDLGEILQERQQQQHAAFLSQFAAPIPFTAGPPSMLPFPLEAQLLRSPRMKPAMPSLPSVADPSTVALVANMVSVERQVGEEVVDSVALASKQSPPAVTQASQEVDGAGRDLAAGGLSLAQTAAVPEAASGAGQAAVALSVQPGAAQIEMASRAAADTRHLASMLRAAATAARPAAVFDAAAAACELSVRWRAAIASVVPSSQAGDTASNPQVQQLQQGFSRSSSGTSTSSSGWRHHRSRSPATLERSHHQGNLSRGSSGSWGQPRAKATAPSKAEWRPVLREQLQPNALLPSANGRAGPWAGKGDEIPVAVDPAAGEGKRPSFAAVAGGSLKGNGHVGVAVRGGNSEEGDFEARWKIQASK
ncbi:hypothetical protein N2152v2_010561 [Parachlorella kessleri]